MTTNALLDTATEIAPAIDSASQERLARLAARRESTSRPTSTGRTSAPAADARKRRLAKRNRAAAVLMSVTTTAGLGAYFHRSDTASSTTLSSTATAATAAGAAAAGTATTLADGTYAGTTNTNRWGPVQVQITVSGHQITEVTTLQTPTGGKSDAINASATPLLAKEALVAQSASIDTISGATYTSSSYKISLQSAIDQARAAAVQAGATA
jgi:uncharacterized protein with FMN-binding domain